MWFEKKSLFFRAGVRRIRHFLYSAGIARNVAIIEK